MFSFANNMEVKTLDSVPEEFRAMYVAKEDQSGFKVNVDVPAVKSAVSIITGLHSSLAAARTEAQGFKGKSVDLSALGEFGSDVTSIAEGVKKKIAEVQTQLTEAQKGGKVNVEKIKEEIAGQFANEGKAKDKRIEALTGQLYDLLVVNSASEAITGLKGQPKLLMPFIKDQVRVTEEDGKFNVYVVDGKNDRRYSGSTGQPLSLKELVSEMKGKEEFARLFDSEAGDGGGGSQNNQTNKNTTKSNQQSELSPTDKISQGLKKGQHQRKETFV